MSHDDDERRRRRGAARQSHGRQLHLDVFPAQHRQPLTEREHDGKLTDPGSGVQRPRRPGPADLHGRRPLDVHLHQQQPDRIPVRTPDLSAPPTHHGKLFLRQR